jgi:DNA invertase Pin-like site-specific DNA recombinase
MRKGEPKAYSYLRFSTPEQMQGDSHRRQMAASRKYADEHDLELDEAFSFQDLGVSAFRGNNATEGELGDFLKAVRAGHVKRGSYLLVESLDRLSRQTVWIAMQQFTDIINQGVNIVTLQDQKVYSTEKGEPDFTDIILSVVTMQRAHEESLTKSKRLAAAWGAKRESALRDGKKLTAMCPAWLELNREANTFEIIEERAEIVRRIYRMTLDGIGRSALTSRFNEEGVPTFGRSKGWHTSYIQKILMNEAVIGVYHPHRVKVIDGKKKRVPAGEPIEGYYPPVVDTETFIKAKRMRKGKMLPTGRTGQRFANLFTKLCFCGNCGAQMFYENKGPRDGAYLVCSSARRKYGDCKRLSWRYPETQCHIIMNLNEVDFREVLPELYERTRSAIDRLQGDVLVKEEELEKTQEALGRIADAFADRPSSPTLLKKLDELEKTEAETQAHLEALKQEYEQEIERQNTACDRLGGLGEALGKYIEIERGGDEEAVYNSRRRLHMHLKRVIEKITFHQDKDDEGVHGTIEITFSGISGHSRHIKVEKGQKNSRGYKTGADSKGPEVVVANAQWPPVDRFVNAKFLEDDVLAGPTPEDIRKMEESRGWS